MALNESGTVFAASTDSWRASRAFVRFRTVSRSFIDRLVLPLGARSERGGFAHPLSHRTFPPPSRQLRKTRSLPRRRRPPAAPQSSASVSLFRSMLFFHCSAAWTAVGQFSLRLFRAFLVAKSRLLERGCFPAHGLCSRLIRRGVCGVSVPGFLVSFCVRCSGDQCLRPIFRLKSQSFISRLFVPSKPPGELLTFSTTREPQGKRSCTHRVATG
uniref:Uncharacterized protein n=1 Tax=Toxoplasma gondii COUG TaxID=1074873 RepID=A0A2G8YDI8_TOXGO|nr:hypothetical protein TGCOUG_261075 [Toxoplasma gondii COUG]